MNTYDEPGCTHPSQLRPADACEAEGLQLPALSDDTRSTLGAVLPAEASLENPVDMLGSATARHDSGNRRKAS